MCQSLGAESTVFDVVIGGVEIERHKMCQAHDGKTELEKIHPGIYTFTA